MDMAMNGAAIMPITGPARHGMGLYRFPINLENEVILPTKYYVMFRNILKYFQTP
jgi:hypothetical protein